MTTYTVNTTADDTSGSGTSGSLRYALSNATDGDTINFDGIPESSTITIANGNGSFAVSHGVTIDGGSHGITISGRDTSSGSNNNNITVFTVAGDPTKQITIQNLTVSNGNGKGAFGSSASGEGSTAGPGGNAAGGIYVQSGALNLVHDTFANNVATGGTGGFNFPSNNNDPSSKGAGGMGGNAAGAVYVEPAAIVTASDLTFENNTASPGDGGPGNPDGAPGTAYAQSNSDTVNNATCFASGTAIRTTRGEVAVEDLAVGDLAVTASGETRPIVWIGHRAVACDVRESRPVRVAAHAFGPMRPARDLVLSPGHPVLIGADADNEGGHLVPIMCLVNGTTVRRDAVDTVTYWHIELDSHDILLAENLAAESYLDWGDRAFFDEGSDHALHNPDFVVPGLAARCRPVALDGPVVEAERRRVDAVFATRVGLAGCWPGEADASFAA